MGLGIDPWRNQCECVVLAEGDEVLLRHPHPTERRGGYERMIGQIARLVDECAERFGQRPAIPRHGHPGARDPQTGLMKNCNTTELNGKPFKEDLERRLGIPVLIANDATASPWRKPIWAVRQHIRMPRWCSASSWAQGWVQASSSTARSSTAITALPVVGHNALSRWPRSATCGKARLRRDLHQRPGAGGLIIRPKAKRHLSLAQIAAASCLRSHRQTHHGPAAPAVPARPWPTWVNILDPDVIVIGGGWVTMQSLYSAGRQTILPFLFNPRFATPIIAPALGTAPGYSGTALLAVAYSRDALLS